MIQEPQNLTDDDRTQIARITALLDAFAILDTGTLFLHETSLRHLSYAAWAWATKRGREITPHIQSGGVECWDISTGRTRIHVYPVVHGQLSGASVDVQEEAKRIQRDAEERVRRLPDRAGRR